MSYSKNILSNATTTPNTTTTAQTHKPKTPFPIKRLTIVKMVARPKKGLWYNCDGKFLSNHCYKVAQFLCLLVETELLAPYEIVTLVDDPK